MGSRKIKDAVNHSTGELVYFKGHAKATYMSDGRTVEDAINNASGGGSIDTSNLATKDDVNAKQDKLVSGTNIATINNNSILGSGNFDLATSAQLRDYQPKLVSGTSIKTINGESILGSGDIVVQGGGGSQKEVIELNSPMINISDMLPNVIYCRNMGVVISVTITSFSTSDSMVDEYTIVGKFSTGAGDDSPVLSITLPEGVVWANGKIPIIRETNEFELSITRRGSLYKAVLTPFKSA